MWLPWNGRDRRSLKRRKSGQLALFIVLGRLSVTEEGECV